MVSRLPKNKFFLFLLFLSPIFLWILLPLSFFLIFLDNYLFQFSVWNIIREKDVVKYFLPQFLTPPLWWWNEVIVWIVSFFFVIFKRSFVRTNKHIWMITLHTRIMPDFLLIIIKMIFKIFKWPNSEWTKFFFWRCITI